VSRPKIVAATETYNEEAFLGHWLAGVEPLVDEIVAIDDGSEDRSAEMLERHPLVTRLVRKKRGKRTEVRDFNRLLRMARERGAEWIMLMGADEVFDARLAERIDELVSDPAVGEYRFRKLWLWRSEDRYRVDRPEKFAQWNPERLMRADPKLKFRYPGGLHVRLASTALRHTHWTPQFGNGGIRGGGPIREIDDIVLIHYAAVDWTDMTRKHIQYAVGRKEEYPRKTADEIVRWAYDALDESTLETAPVPPEWGLDRVAARAAELRAELLGETPVSA
jgi:glycosyltransferase involved in cell wall biosynthesis